MQKINAENIIAGLANTGIYPFNRSVIPESRYAPARVTDRPGNGLFSSMNLCKHFILIFIYVPEFINTSDKVESTQVAATLISAIENHVDAQALS